MDWLSKQDEYIPKEDKDVFIDKSIFSLLGILSEIKMSGEKHSTVIYRINPQLKLVSTILIVALISSSKSFIFLALIFIYLLIMIAQLKKNELKKVICMSLVIPIFTLIALIPSMILGNVYNSVMVVIKILGAVLTTSILSHTTKWNDITRALKLFYIPNIFILTMEITLRYIYILGEFSLEMLNSLRLKSVGKNTNKYMSISAMLGTLFMKSKYMGDELYSAMECRGFQGEYMCNLKFNLKLIDYLYVLFNVVLVLAFIIFSKV